MLPKKAMLCLLLSLYPSYLNTSTLTVNTLDDTASGSGPRGSLRYLMSFADGLPIVFDPDLSGTITLDYDLGPLPEISADDQSITGNLDADQVPKVTIDGSDLIDNGFKIIGGITSSDRNIANLGFINFRCSGICTNCDTIFNGQTTISNCYFGTTNGTDSHPNRFGILIRGELDSNLTIENCVVNNNTEDGMFIASGCNVNISGCTISNNTGNGINLEDCPDGTISNNYLSGNSNGILLEECSNVTVINNTLTANNIYGIKLDTGGFATALNSLLNNSIFANLTSPGISISTSENNNQQPPTITNATLNSDNLTITVEGTSPAIGDGSDVDLTIQFFLTPGDIASLNPQGQTYLGQLTTHASSTFASSFVSSTPVNTDYYLTAIATAKNDTGGTLGDSSIFSEAFKLIANQNDNSNLFTTKLISKYYGSV